MNLSQLLNIFRKQGVPDHFYSIGGLGSGECYGIEKANEKWVIYYSERGVKKVLSIYSSEDAACQELFRHVARIMEDELNKELTLSSE
ncbi:hypothetical protein [uncultured Thiodictyon sp.]|uniref:hypothetical protein n=1 Tax=uncultured Thiodictyon sp. TaxID=1846217 RepID=UPI0025D1FD06|nr:hypothetical protein [uncultured Thiodictyon sp.]